MNGRSPGYSSFVLYLPREGLTVVVFSNIYSSAITTLGQDIASMALGRPHQAFPPAEPATTGTGLGATRLAFQFGPDFYQPNARVELLSDGGDLFLRWPAGGLSALTPLSPDRFVDRAYWEPVSLERDESGQPSILAYGGFRGHVVRPS
jgi:hypothetical protein